MVRAAVFLAAVLIPASALAAERLGKDERKAVGLCVAAYAAPKAISDSCAAGAAAGGRDAESCKAAETARWSAMPGGLAAYPDRAACTCAVATVRAELKRAGVRTLLESPRDPFRADPNNDEGRPDPGNKRKQAVLAVARRCKVPAFQ